MKKISMILVAAIMVFAFMSCEKETYKEDKLEDGIYVGKFNEFGVAYEIRNNVITPIGNSFQQSKTVFVDSESFVAYYGSAYYPKSTICFKTALSKDDWENAYPDTDKEFNGLHYALNENDITGSHGMIFAIKTISGNRAKITIFKANNGYRYETEAKISWVLDNTNAVYSHRKLTFTVIPEITEQQTEEWSITLNPISGYRQSGLLHLYSNDQFRFQIAIIANGIDQ